MHMTATCKRKKTKARGIPLQQHEQDALMSAGRILMRDQRISKAFACQRCLLFEFFEQEEDKKKAGQAHDDPTLKDSDTATAYVEFLKPVLSAGGWQ